ncbi:cytochrome P450 [Boletus coccyginus]|nr:cytochrome P450 [Boletus coccyginus]
MVQVHFQSTPHLFTMQLQVSALSDCVPGVAYAITGIVAATLVITKLSKVRNLDRIPTVGSSRWLGSWWSGHNFETNAIEVIQEGYEKYKSAPFKVADRYRWIVVLGSRQHIDELRKAPDDVLSFLDAASDSIQMKYTMGPELLQNMYHVEIIRSHLTRSLSSLYSEIRDEVSVAFDEVLDLRDGEWKSVRALSAIQKDRRDTDWTDLNLRYTLDVIQGADEIRRFPRFLAPLVAYFMTDVPGTTKRAMRHLGPIIEERLKLQEEYGNDWAEKPNDLLSWLLDVAPEGPERTVKLLTTRVLSTNFAAIHTSATSFSHALFFLAENPQYIRPLREEVEMVVEQEGWSKASLGKMRKIDSFLKESQRLVGIGAVSLSRKAIKDFTFSDGTFIPKGTTVVVPSRSLHLDNEHYENAHVFDPFRFSDMRDEEGEGTKHHFVSTSIEYLPFGHGKHACPGRFFAANELKSMLAHVVMSYDVKLEDNDDKTQSNRLRTGLRMSPDPAAKIMFRRRVD